MKVCGKEISKKLLFGIIAGAVLLGAGVAGAILFNKNKDDEEIEF